VWKNTLENLKNNFVIGIVEIINKKVYEKTADRNIVVVTDEDDIIIRYLLVIKNNATAYSTALRSSDIKFDEHYSNYLKQME
jgi:hypothetical protein